MAEHAGNASNAASAAALLFSVASLTWIEVELPMKVVDIFSPFGGMSHTDDLMLLGIHSTK